MNNMNPNMQQTVPPAAGVYTPPPKRAFTPVETLFAWLCLFAGYLFWRVAPVTDNPFGSFLTVTALYIITAATLLCKGEKFGLLPSLTALSGVAVSASLLFSANTFLHFLAYAYAVCAYAYFVYGATGNRLEKGLSDLLPIDYFKALFVMPFASCGELFRGMLYGKAQSSGKLLGKILLGVLFAAVPTTLVLVLLSYDSDFSKLMNSLFDFGVWEIFSHLLSFAFGIPVGMYLFGLFVSSSDRKCAKVITAEGCKAAYTNIKIAPAATVLASVVPLLAIYLLFFISQAKYYLSAFTGILPDGFSHAEYAREGFFQLCAVSVINLVMLLLVVVFQRRQDGHVPALQKLIALLFSLFTLVLIVTAVSKMVLYIDQFGLTPKRVYATWFMILLALIFILIALRQFIPKMRAVALAAGVCVVMFALLSLSNVDGLIARYNVDRYLAGSLEEVDLEAMDELGDAAIPELVRLYEVMEKQTDLEVGDRILRNELKEELVWQADWRQAQDSGLFSATLPGIRAENALKSMGLME